MNRLSKNTLEEIENSVLIPRNLFLIKYFNDSDNNHTFMVHSSPELGDYINIERNGDLIMGNLIERYRRNFLPSGKEMSVEDYEIRNFGQINLDRNCIRENTLLLKLVGDAFLKNINKKKLF